MILTDEQRTIVDFVVKNIHDRIIAVNAIAGSGKTAVVEAMVKQYLPKHGFYFAFNKAIVEDSAKRFGNIIDVRTIHSLAYQYIRPRKIEEFSFTSIKENISYDDKQEVITTLDNFYRSASTDIEEYVTENMTNEELQELVIKYANLMLTGKIPVTFNYMIKCLHLMLENGDITLDFDLFVFDEVQDAVACSLEIFKLVNADTKVMLGDKYQNIYSFMQTVNGFDEIRDNIQLLNLTQSFRCNEEIADTIQEYGRKYLQKNFQYKGNPDILRDNDYKIAYISRTNATLIERMARLLEQGKSFTLTRNINEIFSYPIALLSASYGKPVYTNKYKYLEKEYKNYRKIHKDSNVTYFEYMIDLMDDSLLKNTVSMLNSFRNKGINIYNIKEQVTNLKPNSDIILTTAHAFKGLECDRVYIEEDLNNCVNISINNLRKIQAEFPTDSLENCRSYLSKGDIEDLNTYYVALSRARTSIKNCNYIA